MKTIIFFSHPMKIFTALCRRLFVVAGLGFAVVPVYATSFSDVASSRNKTAIQYLSEQGVLGGYSDGTFKPSNTINRAELAKILVAANNVSPTVSEYHDCFSDVTNEWFAPYVCYAKVQGWVSGYSDGSFRPGNPVNTAEAIKMILNAQGITLSSSTENNTYSDVDASAWYATYIATANSKGLLEVDRGKLGVGNNMTRGGVAESIYRSLSIKASGSTKFEASTEEQSTTSDRKSGSGGMMKEDLQKYVDEANAASDKTIITKEEFEMEMKALREKEMASMSSQQSISGQKFPGGNGGPRTGSGGKPPQGQPPSGGNEPQDMLATATTFWKYTDTSGNEVLLALDASGTVVMKWPMEHGRGGPGGQPPQSK
jgi:hypothetical protein